VLACIQRVNANWSMQPVRHSGKYHIYIVAHKQIPMVNIGIALILLGESAGTLFVWVNYAN